MIVWVLTDNRFGGNTQAMGIAEALGHPFTIKEIKYNRWIKLPNFILGRSLLGITYESRRKVTERPYPDIVVAAGRRLAPVSRHIKKLNPSCKLIHIMHTGFLNNKDFTLPVILDHDRIPFLSRNFFRVTTSPHRITKEKLEAEILPWKERLAGLPRPHMAVFIGGSTKKTVFTEGMARELGNIIQKASEQSGCSILITTSKRTGKRQEQILKESITTPNIFYSWSTGGDNPYFAFMASADAIIVTGDSMSMCSEAVSIGIPVYIYAPAAFLTDKQTRLHSSLKKNELADIFDGCANIIVRSAEKGKTIRNSAYEIAEEFYKRLAL